MRLVWLVVCQQHHTTSLLETTSPVLPGQVLEELVLFAISQLVQGQICYQQPHADSVAIVHLEGYHKLTTGVNTLCFCTQFGRPHHASLVSITSQRNMTSLLAYPDISVVHRLGKRQTIHALVQFITVGLLRLAGSDGFEEGRFAHAVPPHQDGVELATHLLLYLLIKKRGWARQWFQLRAVVC